jgi:hypothetical protein
MAVIELIFPKFKPDQGIIDEMERDWPIIFKKLTNPNPGILSTFRGWILTENGRNVREENRAFLLFGKSTVLEGCSYAQRANLTLTCYNM